MPHPRRSYLPAAGRHWRLPFYDGLATALGADHGRALLLDGISLPPHARILEIGCGTGSLLVALARIYPGATIIGVDPDPGALEIARRKRRSAQVSFELRRGFAEALDAEDASFDGVVSSFVFHHLDRDTKERSLREIVRVLRPGGRFHMLDLDGPSGAEDRGWLARWLHSRAPLEDNDEGRVLRLVERMGLERAEVVARLTVHFARIICYRATAPDSGGTTPTGVLAAEDSGGPISHPEEA